MAKISTADHGTWLDGAHGWTNGYRCVERAISFGWTVPEEYAEGWAAFEANHGDSDTWENANGDDGGFVDAATEYLQEQAPEGWVFRWDAGELSLMPAWMDCAADGNGCDVSENFETGETFVEPCPDHKPERKIRIVATTMTDDFTTYTVMLWDEDGEILSGSEEIQVSPRPKYGVVDTGEYWFPETLRDKRVREIAEKLIRRTRCEGHYDDDRTLTSGVGIGESTFCDGSCQG